MVDREIAYSQGMTEETFKWLDVMGNIFTGDLREDFKDGDDIILRWPGNKEDWAAARELVEEAKDLQALMIEGSRG